MTEVMVNVGSARAATRAAALPVAGVGLMRAEFLFYTLGRHPRDLIDGGGHAALSDVLEEGMEQVAAAFQPRPVRYRALDFKSNEMRSLVGGDRYEDVEGNPALGLRGCSRYQRDPEVFDIELRALAAVRARGFRNLQLMVPFVRDPSEVELCRRAMRDAGLDGDVQLWAMVEVPALMYMLEELAPWIDGVSIGTNDLTQLLLGVDRDNAAVAALYDDGHAAVVAVASTIVETARSLGLGTSICGDAPSRQAELLATLVALGIDSISVSSDAVESTQAAIGEASRVR